MILCRADTSAPQTPDHDATNHYPRQRTTEPHHGRAPASRPDPPVGQRARSPSLSHNDPGPSRDGRPTLPGIATLHSYRIPIRSAGSAWARAAFLHGDADVLECSSSHPYQHVIFRAQQFALPRSGIKVQDRPGLLGKPRVPRKNPVLVLPGLDRRLVQHPPHRAAADLLTQGLAGSPHQVGQRLATEWFFGLRDHFTSHRVDQRLVKRGKKRPFGRVPHNLRWRNRRRPSDFANVVPDQRTDRPPQPPRRFPGRAAHEEAVQAESVGQFGPLLFGGTQCREPLARNRQGRYRERDSVLAWRHPFLAGFFGGLPPCTKSPSKLRRYL